VRGVNHLGQYGRWAFAEFTDVYKMQSDFEAKVEDTFNKMTAILLEDKAV
jgi:type III restriction enzyme